MGDLKTMKKILPIMVIGILVLSGLGAAGFTDEETSNELILKTEEAIVNISPLNVQNVESDYIELSFEDTNSFLMEAGKPMLPKIVKTFELPFGVKNVKVEVIPGEIVEESVSKEIRPSPSMLPRSTAQNIVYNKQKKDLTVYSSNDPYPSDWYSYSVRAGLNKENLRVTFVIVHIYPVKYIPNDGKILVAESTDIKITYEEPETVFSATEDEYDLVIIAPRRFKNQLQRLVDHKNKNGIKTKTITTESIFKFYNERDKPEEIKYFIKDAIEDHNIKYVLLVGGLKSQIYAKPRDDANQGSRGWYVPVRYTNLFDNPKFPLKDDLGIHDPGVICDLYYADIYDGEGIFSSWDPNDDGVFASWNKPGVEDDNISEIDMVPDVCLGRLACRSIREVKTVVDKIIKYENTSSSEKGDWFNKVTVISGDGFLDQQDWNIQWDTTGKKGFYTIYAQSTNSDMVSGPIDTIPIKIDRRKETKITFNHDDHLNPELQNGYPAPPIAEIVSISKGDILGHNNYEYTPSEGEAFCNDFNPWANISYVSNVLTIRGKSYDPRPYGNITHLHVWIDNMDGITIFSEWRNNTEMYYEGEWTTGEKVLKGRGGALYYMDGFEKDIVWASNGRFTGQDDVLTALNEGSGFMFMSGHGSPNVWADHYPGVPGNRGPASITGLRVTTLGARLPPFPKPVFPIDTLSNDEKLPVAVIGGCHNSQFNVSMVMGFYDILPYYFKFLPKKSMWCHGTPVPECFSWRLVRNPKGGSIATMGNTGLGYGMPGNMLTTGGGDGWITIEFFKQYGTEDQTILGNAYAQTLTSYIQNFDMTDLESGHTKTVQQWILLGDPSLRIGGFPTS